jgi:hypothetical protein
MNKERKQNLSLDRLVTYKIQVPGEIDSCWSDRDVELRIDVHHEVEGLPVSTLIGKFDQAALQGLLRRLYSLGIPLISVKWVEEI